jgi:diguanylate cyclase (GGDEF)-like protein
MAYSAAVMYGAGVLIDVVETLVPGGQSFSLLPGFGSLALAGLVLLFGPRLPVAALAALGPLGVVGIAVAVGTTNVPGDGAILYTWPVLWEAYFFGRRGTILIVACVGVAHGVALLSMPTGTGNLDRWIDVMASVTIIGTVVEILAARNRGLLRRISEEARVDELTGLLNRRGFDEHAGTELARARRREASLAVVSFDLDFFKRVNDEFGHDAGDRVLQRFADCLRAERRGTDVVARMGGEEFLALLPDADLDEALAFAERVRAALRSDPGPEAIRITVSAGLAAATAPDSIEPLLKAADMALYAAKSQGRDMAVAGRPTFDPLPSS